MTILLDKAYEEANRRSADWAGQMIERRFAEVYGDRGSQVLTDIQLRMDSNVRSDGRATPLPSGTPDSE